jgi:hypothetical protein
MVGVSSFWSQNPWLVTPGRLVLAGGLSVISSRTGLDRPGQVLAQQNGERPTVKHGPPAHVELHMET